MITLAIILIACGTVAAIYVGSSGWMFVCTGILTIGLDNIYRQVRDMRRDK